MSMPIAFVMKSFSWDFRRSGQLGPDHRRLEPYVLAFCADGDGQVHRSMTPIYVNSPRVGRQNMTGTGHIFYGPKDPKGLLLFAVAIVESDADIRDAGERMREILASDSVNKTTRAISDTIVAAVAAAGSSVPVGALVTGLVVAVRESLGIVAKAMRTNPDDIHFVDSGSFLADTNPPYQWGRRIDAHSPLRVRGRPAFSLEYEILRLNEAQYGEIERDVGKGHRALPSVFNPR